MKHRLLTALALAALACAVVAATAAGGGEGPALPVPRRRRLGEPDARCRSGQGGNHVALKALIGQSQNQSFTLGAKTEVLVWSHGVPHVGSVADLKQGD